MDYFKHSKQQLIVARDLCRSMMRSKTGGTMPMAILQQIEQVIGYLDRMENKYEIVEKSKKL
jgi:hypothetical protein